MKVDDIYAENLTQLLDTTKDYMMRAYIVGLQHCANNTQLTIRDGNRYITLTAHELLDALNEDAR